MKATSERQASKTSGFGVFVLEIAALAACIALFAHAVRSDDPVLGLCAAGTLLAFILVLPGFFVVQPNEARVVLFLGRYAGSVRDAGFFWTNPFTSRKPVTLRVRNFQSERLKVNDASGNPIEIAAVVVWRVADPARALLDVDSYEAFVAVQAETAVRGLAARFPYDAHDTGAPSLRGSPDEAAETLRRELQGRLEVAGVLVVDARISHLAYAPEIAQAMLRRQQADAVIAARQRIVDGAVGMVETALKRLREEKVVELDEERKATMVNNLLVALVSEQAAHPVLNAGTLYG